MFLALVLIFLGQMATPSHAGEPASATPLQVPQTAKSLEQGSYHVVKPGENLYRIGILTGLGHEKLARWNGLTAPYPINLGQTLRLYPRRSPSELGASPPKPLLPETTAPPLTARPTQQPKAGTHTPKPPHAGTATTPLSSGTKPLPPTNKPLKPPKLPAKGTEKTQSLPSPSKTGTHTPKPPHAGISTTPLSKPLPPTNKPLKPPKLPAKENRNKPSSLTHQANQPVRNAATTKSAEPLKNAAASVKPKSLATQPAETRKSPKTTEKQATVSGHNQIMLKSGFQWPLKGAVLKNFSKSNANAIGIASRLDTQAVKAAAAGKIVYQGPGLEHYQNLIVIKHDGGYSTIYANNNRILVKEGERVRKGQAIAEVLAAGNKQKPLHFEIRKAGQPINALAALPPG